MSVILENNQNQHILICKGAVEEIMRLSTHVEINGEILEVTAEHDEHRKRRVKERNSEGFRVIAVAYRMFPGTDDTPHYSIKDESDLTLLGYLAFLDPPKDSATEALSQLLEYSVSVKILTGDNEIVTGTICKQVGLSVDHILLGPEIEALSDGQLGEATETTTVFAKLSPAHKERIIHFIGPISSIFDYLTFFIMIYIFNCWTNPVLFHTGWFVESLFTQTLIIHVIRTNKIPFLQSRASKALILASLAIVAIGAYLQYSPLAGTLGFVPQPPLYWLLLFGMLVAYVILTQITKTWFYRKYGD